MRENADDLSETRWPKLFAQTRPTRGKSSGPVPAAARAGALPSGPAMPSGRLVVRARRHSGAAPNQAPDGSYSRAWLRPDGEAVPRNVGGGSLVYAGQLSWAW